MENPGCITVNDLYIFKDKVKIEAITYRAIVVAHVSFLFFKNFLN